MKNSIKNNHITIVYTTGVFDLIHPGHLNLLRRARALGDKLIVGVQEDDSIEKQKGKKPIMTCEQRIAMLEALPFVDVVFPYIDLDQRRMLSLLKPDIMVQGGDWLKSGDRGIIIQYLKDNNIKLVQFPYTKDISSTEIKERVYSDLKQVKRDKALDFDFYKRLKLVPIKNLLVYEDFDPNRTKKIIYSISASKTFFNPITVGYIGESDKYLVIDGVNRLEALRKLKASYVFVQIVNYLDPDEVELRGNEHYLNCLPSKFKNLASKTGISIKNTKELSSSMKGIERDCILATIYMDNNTYFLDSKGSLDLDRKTDQLNRFVNSYKKHLNICRKSEVGDVSQNYPISIKFNKFTTSDIIEIAYKNLHLESGITWHLINNHVVHFKVPASVLINGFDNEKKAAAYMKKIIKEKTNNLSIRRYLYNVYICDEWEN